MVKLLSEIRNATLESGLYNQSLKWFDLESNLRLIGARLQFSCMFLCPWSMRRRRIARSPGDVFRKENRSGYDGRRSRLDRCYSARRDRVVQQQKGRGLGHPRQARTSQLLLGARWQVRQNCVLCLANQGQTHHQSHFNSQPTGLWLYQASSNLALAAMLKSGMVKDSQLNTQQKQMQRTRAPTNFNWEKKTVKKNIECGIVGGIEERLGCLKGVGQAKGSEPGLARAVPDKV